MGLILNQFEKFCDVPLKKFILKDDFKSKVADFFNDLSAKTFEQLIADLSGNQASAAAKPLIASKVNQQLIDFSKELLAKFNLTEDLTRLDQIEKRKNQPQNKFKQWQTFFKSKLLATHKEEIIEELWLEYLAKQKQNANSTYTPFTSESFDAYTYQMHADPIKRLGALMFELISEYINSGIYACSEGKTKLFNEIESKHNNSKDNQIQNYWRTITGSKFLPPPA